MLVHERPSGAALDLPADGRAAVASTRLSELTRHQREVFSAMR